MRIGLVHLTQRQDSWGNYISWGLRQFFPQHEPVWCGLRVDVDEFKWAKPDCDVYVRIEDSGNYDVLDEYRPLIYWAGDTHISDGVPRKRFAREADFTFVAQKNAVGEIGDEWLPHAAWYKRNADERPCFLSSAIMLSEANPIFRERSLIAMRLKRDFDSPKTPVNIRTGIYFKDMADLYGKSQIVWHCSVGNDVAMRHFEGAACGAAVVCSRVKDNGIEDIFGDLLFQYDTDEELMDILARAADTRKALGEGFRERGRELHKLVTAKHMYRHRLERLVAKCQELAK